jgi:RNA polymerase sigma factor (sigma-70 family)
MDGFLGLAKGEIERLRRTVRNRIASAEESEDILQDVFLALVAKWNLGEKIHDAMAWALRTAANKIVDRYRQRPRQPLSLDGPADETLSAGDLWEMADADVAGPEEAAEREELRQILAEAVAALPEEQRRVFLASEVQGESFREMEARTGVPLGTLLSRKRYAVIKLRKKLSEKLVSFRED